MLSYNWLITYVKVLLQDATDLGPERKCDLKTAVGDLQTAMCDKVAWRNDVRKIGQCEVPSSKKSRRA